MPKEEKEIKTETTENKSIKYKVAETYQVSGFVVKDISSGTELSVIDALAKILNDLDDVKRGIL